MTETTNSEKIEARANKRVQRRRGMPKASEHINRIAEACKAYPLNRIKRVNLPGLTALQRAILNVYFLPVPGVASLPATRVAEIVRERLGRCTYQVVGRFWTSAKCQKAMAMISDEYKKDATLEDLILRDMALAGDIRAIKLRKELSGEYQPAALQQITFNQYNIGDDAAKAGFLQTVSNLKQIGNAGKGESKDTDQAVDAEFEVVKDDGSDVK